MIRFCKPDTVVVELCKDRIGILLQKPEGETNKSGTQTGPKLFFILTIGQEATPIEEVEEEGVFQKLLHMTYSRVSSQLQVVPGGEFRAGFEEAVRIGAAVMLGDRPVQVTLHRTWGALSTYEKIKFILQFVYEFNFDIKAADVERMKNSDLLTEIIEEVSREFPSLIKPILQERNQFLAQALKIARGPVVVGIVGKRALFSLLIATGFGHVDGISQVWNEEASIEELLVVPPVSKWTKPIIIGSLVSLVLLLMLLSFLACYLLYSYSPIPVTLLGFLFLCNSLIFREIFRTSTSDMLDMYQQKILDKQNNKKAS